MLLALECQVLHWPDIAQFSVDAAWIRGLTHELLHQATTVATTTAMTHRRGVDLLQMVAINVVIHGLIKRLRVVSDTPQVVRIPTTTPNFHILHDLWEHRRQQWLRAHHLCDNELTVELALDHCMAMRLRHQLQHVVWRNDCATNVACFDDAVDVFLSLNLDFPIIHEVPKPLGERLRVTWAAADDFGLAVAPAF